MKSMVGAVRATATPSRNVAVGFSSAFPLRVTTLLPSGNFGGQVRFWAGNAVGRDRTARPSSIRFMTLSLLADDQSLIGLDPGAANDSARRQTHLDIHFRHISQPEMTQGRLTARIAVPGRYLLPAQQFGRLAHTSKTHHRADAHPV